jgi:hypothetical protein
MNTETQDPLMQQITEALEARPAVSVPDDFAARLMARIPQQQQRKLRVPALMAPSHYGHIALVAAIMLVLVGTIAVAPLTRTSSLWFGLQFLLLTQLVALVLLYGKTRRQLN